MRRRFDGIGAIVFALALACVLAVPAALAQGAVSASSTSSRSAGADSGYVVAKDPFADAAAVDLADGIYQIEVSLEGGSGKATVVSPAELEVFDGKAVVTLVWSSSYYDYMVVANKKYLPVNEEGDSTFVVPVTAFDEPMPVIGDTTAMSEAHEVAYELTVSRASAKALRDTSKQDATTKKAASSSSADSVNEAKQPAAWPWAVFAVCAVLSAICIAVSVIAVYRYRAKKA